MVAGEQYEPDARVAGLSLTVLAEKHFVVALGIILVIAAALRIFLALNSAYIWDESREWIPTANAISLSWQSLELPLRTSRHGAFASYIIHASSALFGESHFGFRFFNALLGVATVLVIALTAKRFFSPLAGLVAAVALTFNEFHIFVSMVAVQISPYLFFTALTLHYFLRSTESGKPTDLLLTAVFSGLSFLCYEIGALNILALFLILIFVTKGEIFTRPVTYAGAFVILIIASPDLYYVFFDGTDTTGYGEYLNDISFPKFNPMIVYFFIPGTIEFAYAAATGGAVVNEVEEYSQMNDIFGFLYIAVVAWFLWRGFWGLLHERTEQSPAFLLAVFVLLVGVVLLFIDTDAMGGHWFYGTATLLPACVLIGALASSKNTWPFSLMLVAAIVLATFNVVANNVGVAKWWGVASPSRLPGDRNTYVEVNTHFDACMLCERGFTPVLSSVDVQDVGKSVMRHEGGDVMQGQVPDILPDSREGSYHILIDGNFDQTYHPFVRHIILNYNLVKGETVLPPIEVGFWISRSDTPVVHPDPFWIVDP